MTVTVIMRGRPESPDLVTIGKEEDTEALVVFRGPEDARAFQEVAGWCDERHGFELTDAGREDLAAILDERGLLYVAMPEPWTGEGGVDLFNADAFLLLLEDAEG